jgi:uncharacterized membrane protein YbhN (UPF0104 family)
MVRTVFLVLGMAVLALLLWHLGASEILDLLGRIGWYSIPIFSVYAAYHATRALALHSCVLRPGVLGYRDALAIRLSGTAIQTLTFAGPLVAEPARAFLLERRGLTLKEGFAATITEQIIYSLVTAGLSIAGLLYLVRRFEPAPVVSVIAIGVAFALGAFLVASAIAVARRFYLIGTIIAGLARIGVLRGRLRPDMNWINRMEDILLAVLRDRPVRLTAVALIEAMAQALLVLELYWLLRALELVIPRSYPFVIEASTKVSGTFFFIPMQLGATEGTYAVIFDTLGLPAAAGFALAFARRTRSLVIAGVGLTALGLMTRNRTA